MTVCSIIIPTFNTCELTLRCIQDILDHPPEDDYDIAIVDNHSADNTVRETAARFPQVRRMVNTANLGYAVACNQGARAARGDYVLFLNSDTSPRPGALQALLNRLKNNKKAGIAGAKLLGPDGSLIQMSWGWPPMLAAEFLQSFLSPDKIQRSPRRQKWAARLQRSSRRVSFVCGACLMIRRETFDQLSGFNEAYELYFEDADLCYRAVQKGWQVDFVAEALVVHHLSQSGSESQAKKSLIYQQSHITFYRDHAPRWALALLKAWLLLKRTTMREYSKEMLDIIFERKKITLS